MKQLLKSFSVKINETETEKKMFVNKYWIDKIKYKGEEKERFMYLDETSEVRKLFEDIYENYEIDDRFIRFINVISDEKKGKELKSSFIVYIGLNVKENNKMNEELSNKFISDDNNDEVLEEIFSDYKIKNEERKKEEKGNVIGVISSGEFSNEKLITEILDGLEEVKEFVISDTESMVNLVEKYADNKNISKKIFSPNSHEFKEDDSELRNSSIIENSDFVIIFWNERVEGKLDLIKNCNKYNKDFKVISI